MGLVIFLVGLIALWEGFYLLFVEVLNGEPGIYTARYADDELALNSNLFIY